MCISYTPSLSCLSSYLRSPSPPSTPPAIVQPPHSSLRTEPHRRHTSCSMVHCLTLLANTSKTILKRKGLSAEPWRRPTFTSKPSVVPTPLLTLVFTSLHISFISRTYFSGTIFSLKHLHSYSLGTLSYAFSRSMNTICKSLPFFLYFSAICLRIDIAFVIPRLGINPNCSSATSTSSLTLLSTMRSQIFIVWERSFHSSGICFCSSILIIKSHSRSTPSPPSTLHASTGISSGPVALFLFIFFNALSTSALFTPIVSPWFGVPF